MICRNCQKKFYVKRSYLSLFENKTYYICEKCRRGYPLRPQVERIPLENKELVCISFFENSYRLNLEAYSLELSYLIEQLMKKHSDYFFIYQDVVFLSDLLIEWLNFLSIEENKAILLVCSILKK